MNAQAFIGSKISLISRVGIRYEGILCSIDADNSTVALSQVRSFGTEDRSIDDPIPPRDEIYKYIMFRGCDIQDIHVSEYPNKKMSLISQDSAIIKVSPLEGEDNFAKRPSFGRRSLDNRRRSESIPRYGNSNYAAEPRPMQDARYLPRMRDRSEDDAQPYYVTRGRRYFNRRSPVVYYRGNSVPKHQGDNMRTARRRSTTESRNRLDSESQKSARTKYTSDYDFESENAKIADELEKLEVSKGVPNKRKTHKTTVASSNRQASGDKASDHLTNDSNSSGAGSDCTDNSDELVNLTSKEPNLAEFYNQKKSFYDNISSEAKDRAKGKTIRSLNWREEKKLNSETFGLVNRSRRAPYYSGYFYRLPGRSDYMRMGLYPPGLPNAGRNRGYWRNPGYSYYEHRPMLVGWR